MSNGSSTRTTSSQQPPPSANTPTRSFLSSLPFSMPTLPSLPRFSGDGFDFRRPASARIPPDIIDLTDDNSPEEVPTQHRPHPRSNNVTLASHTNPIRRPFRDFIDIDDESTRATIDSSSQSPDVELVEVRSVRSQHASDTDDRRRTDTTHARHGSTLRPPGSSHTDHRPFAVGGWNGLRQHAQGQQHTQHSARQLHQLLHANHHHHHHHHHHAPADVLLLHGNRDIILPGDLDFVTQGFRMGDVTADPPQPAPPTYDAPPPAREGFTRSPKEEDVLLCPNCEDELGTGKDEVKRQVWVVKACGHVRVSRLRRSSSFLLTGSRCIVENVQKTDQLLRKAKHRVQR